MTNLFLTRAATATILLLALSSCGTSKSTELKNISSSNNLANHLLASCSKSANSDISINLSAVTDSMGQVDTNWTKIKFNFLSTTSTAAGNTIRFFKWKTINNQSSLDQTALQTMIYNLDSGQPVTNLSATTPMSEITTTRGLYIQLNDSTAAYQVLKAVVYDSAGKIVAQIDSLIPQFSSKISDYSTLADGSARSQNLINLHPLTQVTTSTWSDSDYTNYFQNLCF